MLNHPFSIASRRVRGFHRRVKELQQEHEAVLVAGGFPPWYARSLDGRWMRLFACVATLAFCGAIFCSLPIAKFASPFLAGAGIWGATVLFFFDVAGILFLPVICTALWRWRNSESRYLSEGAFQRAMYHLEDLHAFRLAAIAELAGRLSVDEVAELTRLCPEPGRHGCYPTYYREDLDWDVATRRFETRLGELLARPAAAF